MSDIHIRDAVAGDVRAVAVIARESAEAHAALDPRFYDVPDMEESVRRAERHLREEDRTTLVAVAGTHVVGFVELVTMPAPAAGSMVRASRAAEIGIAVSAGHRGEGIGRALMEVAEDRAARDGVELLTVNAHAANDPALRLYRSMGYEPLGVFLHRWIE